MINFLMNWCRKKGRVFNITGTDTSDVYMIRYIVFKSNLFCVYIHRFLRSDKDEHHDHPWNFFTYIISGAYEEELLDPNTGRTSVVFRKQGTLAYRRHTDIHKVRLRRSWQPHDCKEAPLTICFMGPRKQEWGFWIPHLYGYGKKPYKKILWREFLGITGEAVGNE